MNSEPEQIALKGIGTVNFLYLNKPFNQQLMTFASSIPRLQGVMPATIGLLRCAEPKSKKKSNPFMPYTRTLMTSVGIPEEKRIVLIKDPIFAKMYAQAMVEAHKQKKEYVVSKCDEEIVRETIKALEKKDLAISVKPGIKTLDPKKFGEQEIPYFVFTDESIGAKAQNYGDLVSQKRSEVTCYFGSEDYLESREGIFLNLVRVGCPGGIFYFDGDLYFYLNDFNGAFGVQFNTTGGGRAKNQYSPSQIRQGLNKTGITGNLEKTVIANIK